MLKIRPYLLSDGENVINWLKDEKSFYQWSAGILGEYPINADKLRQYRIIQ